MKREEQTGEESAWRRHLGIETFLDLFQFMMKAGLLEEVGLEKAQETRFCYGNNNTYLPGNSYT